MVLSFTISGQLMSYVGFFSPPIINIILNKIARIMLKIYENKQ